MVKPGFEIFEKSAGVWGLVLKSPRKFKRINHYLEQYPEDAAMREGEEILFWVGQSQTGTIAKILAPRSSLASALFRDEAREAGGTE